MVAYLREVSGAAEHSDDGPWEWEPIEWRQSARGNWWTRIGALNIVIFPSRRTVGEWCLRLQYDDQPGRFLKRTWRSLEAAQRWVEENAHTVIR
jgi:hypothetical protein